MLQGDLGSLNPTVLLLGGSGRWAQRGTLFSLAVS